jgi:hypothetical protein
MIEPGCLFIIAHGLRAAYAKAEPAAEAVGALLKAKAPAAG